MNGKGVQEGMYREAKVMMTSGHQGVQRKSGAVESKVKVRNARSKK
jgi:hypothetical protein